MEDEIKRAEASENEEAVTAEAEETAADEVEIGNIKISVDVVATIAGIAAAQAKGVAGMYSSFAGGIAEILGAKKNPSKGVKVDMSGENVKIDLYIVVEYGVRIPELAWEIQESVKNNVETMTGLGVEKVNIHIEGVSFAAEETSEEEEIAAEELPEITD